MIHRKPGIIIISAPRKTKYWDIYDVKKCIIMEGRAYLDEILEPDN